MRFIEKFEMFIKHPVSSIRRKIKPEPLDPNNVIHIGYYELCGEPMRKTIMRWYKAIEDPMIAKARRRAQMRQIIEGILLIGGTLGAMFVAWYSVAKAPYKRRHRNGKKEDKK